MESEIWMRKSNNKECSQHECMCSCVGDFLIASKSPQVVADVLINQHEFKLNGTGSISYNVDCDFTQDSNNELCLAPRKNIEKMSDSYASIFGSNPKKNS